MNSCENCKYWTPPKEDDYFGVCGNEKLDYLKEGDHSTWECSDMSWYNDHGMDMPQWTRYHFVCDHHESEED